MTKRKNPRPFVVGRVEEGATCYLPASQMKDARKSARVAWRFRNELRTLALPNQTYVKTLSAWPGADGERVGKVVDKCASLGLGHPSGWGDVYHRMNRHPVVKPSFNAALSRYVAGGWQESFYNGLVDEPVYCFDLNGAYAWAACGGLPNSATFRLSKPTALPERGVLVADFTLDGDCLYPYPLRVGRQTAALDVADVRRFGPRIHRVYRAVEWTGESDVRGTVDAVFNAFDFADAKKILRSFWGRWLAGDALDMDTIESGEVVKTRRLKNIFANVPWADAITRRVRMRLYDEAIQRGALAVYVDALLTTRTLSTGAGLGEWKLARTFPRIHLRGARGFSRSALDTSLGF